MATYKEIKGVTVQTRDTDPVLNVNSWSSGGSMNTDRTRGAGDGTQTAFITFGGTTPSPGTQLANTETYNGTSFTEVADLNTGRTDLAGAGTTTASLAATGSAGTGIGTFVESWNGSAWTETTENNTARQQLAGFGIQTAMVIASGLIPPFSNLVEYWNGSSWTEVSEVNTARQGLGNGGAGVYTAGIIAGGRKAHPSDPGQETTDVEEWDGSSWTEVNNLNEAKQSGGLFGTQSSALYAGGADTGTLGSAESWDGTNWTETSDLATARYYVSAGGTSNTSGIIAGGSPAAATEEWSLPPPTSTILREGDLFLSGGTALKGFGKAGGIPSATWSSGGALNTARYRASTSDTGGSSSSSLFFGGYAPGSPPPSGYFDETEQYNGTSWTEVADLNEGGSSAAGFGSATSAIMAGGGGGTRANDEVESWNGSSWTEVAELNTGRGQTTAAGSSGTAGIVFTGRVGPPGDTVNTETWNGSSWTEVANINTARDEAGGCGTVTAAMLVCGMKEEPLGPPSGWFQSNLHEQWDGSSWTETTETNESVSACVAIGHSSSGLKVAGTQGAVPAVQSKNEFWNGSSWTELADLSTGRNYVSQAGGSAASGLLAGGNTTPSGSSSTTATEEWNADLALSTVTVS